METNNILTANILDILFDGRNKEYGAYDLRKSYNKRVNTALGITAIAILIFVVGAAFIGNNAKSSNTIVSPDVTTTATIRNLKKDKKIEPKKMSKPKPVKTVAFVPPIIVRDILVKNSPIENKDLIDSRIGTKNIDGKIDVGSTPVEIKENSPIEEPGKKELNEPDKFIPIEIEARFSGNWNNYVKKEIEKNIDELTESGESGTCIVRFVVSKDGTVSNVEAITMKGTKLAEVAVNAIRKGPKWIPAIQNGTPVNAYRQQPITFTIND